MINIYITNDKDDVVPILIDWNQHQINIPVKALADDAVIAIEASDG